MITLGSDVGGTFTDCILHDARLSRLAALKVPTTPANPAEGAVRGLTELLSREGVSPGNVTRVLHGTTTATNAVLTRRGARVALLTNAGFEDVVEIARQDRPDLYDPLTGRPPPLVPRESRFGVRGRLGPAGEEVEPLSEAEVEAHGPALAAHEAAAVVFLHAYASSAHERRAAELLAKLAPGLPVTTSHETAPEFREYERMSTTVVNAFLLPVMDRYLAAFETGLRDAGITAPVFVLESSGGVATPRAARRRPVRAVLSGPAGGAAACAFLSRLTGEARLLGLDMGGTSTDLSVTVDGAAREAPEGEVAGLPLRMPMLDIKTIGAGGGSVARVDAAGLLKVGPESAEATPGPACYGRGGTEPTITDAHAVLGHVETLLGGAFKLDRLAAFRALTPVADRLGLAVEEAAEAVVRVADANMLAAARLAATARGHDPREFALVAFGGAGPLHAVSIARGLGAKRVLVPPASGVLSAFGMLTSDLRRDGVRTWLRGPEGADEALKALSKEVAAEFAADGAPPQTTVVRYQFDGRYAGQSHELAIPLDSPRDVARAGDLFHEAHLAAFGYDDRAAEVELVNLRVTALAPPEAPVDPPRLAEGDAEPPARASRGTRSMRRAGETVDVRVWLRAHLLAGNVVEGPAVVESEDATLLVPPGTRARVDPSGTLFVEVDA